MSSDDDNEFAPQRFGVDGSDDEDEGDFEEEGDFEDRRFYFVVVSISTESEQCAECDRKNGAEFHRANEAILIWTKVFTEGSI